MTTKVEQGIGVDGIHFKNPLGKEVPDVTETIVVSRKRFALIQSGMSSVLRYRDMSNQKYNNLLESAHNLANALMPDHVNHVLREFLTPRQYQRALRANQEGRMLKFARAKK